MDRLVTASTKRDEIAFRICPEGTARLYMMYLKVCETPAVLTSPSITLENLAAELSIGFGIKTPPSRPQTLHEGCRISSINCVCRGGGRRPNRRRKEHSRTPGSPLSRFAPARKSAQIISRQ